MSSGIPSVDVSDRKCVTAGNVLGGLPVIRITAERFIIEDRMKPTVVGLTDIECTFSRLKKVQKLHRFPLAMCGRSSAEGGGLYADRRGDAVFAGNLVTAWEAI
jgi:hypothetical protein